MGWVFGRVGGGVGGGAGGGVVGDVRGWLKSKFTLFAEQVVSIVFSKREKEGAKPTPSSLFVKREKVWQREGVAEREGGAGIWAFCRYTLRLRVTPGHFSPLNRDE